MCMVKTEMATFPPKMLGEKKAIQSKKQPKKSLIFSSSLLEKLQTKDNENGPVNEQKTRKAEVCCRNMTGWLDQSS
mgnify:CR=1 FL=1